MPKSPSNVIKQFRVRVDGQDDHAIQNFMTTNCSRFLLVHHVTTTENPHYHAYCETRFSQGNFSTKIKAELNVKGGDYSNKSCADDRKNEYLSYLFNTKKGNVPRLVASEGFSILDLKIYQEQARTIAEEFETRMKSEKKTQYELAMLVIERVGHDTCWNASVVYDEVISVLKASHMIARPYVVKDLISTVMAYAECGRANHTIKEITLKFFQ